MSASPSNAPAPARSVNRPCFLEYKDVRFVIMDSPTDENLHSYLDTLKKRKVTLLVRACEPAYATGPLEEIGIRVVDLPFPDGDPPPEHVINQWRKLVDAEFSLREHKGSSKPRDNAIAVHCVAGLGRAPALVAIALMEAGMDPLDTVAFIRKKRRGAINARQISFIEKYQPRSQQGCCLIM